MVGKFLLPKKGKKGTTNSIITYPIIIQKDNLVSIHYRKLYRGPQIDMDRYQLL